MKKIIAAGGLVQNTKGEFLFIFRRGRWDLPKGKVEKEETVENAALREVEEECGISGLEITRPLTITYHNYELKGKPVIKQTHWYLMKTDWQAQPVPQLEEEIKEAIWADKNHVKRLLSNTYDNIKEVIKAAGLFNHESGE